MISVVLIQEFSKEAASARTTAATAALGGLAGLYGASRFHGGEGRQDRLLRDLGALDPEVYKKRQRQRILETAGMGLGGAAVGAALPHAAEYTGRKALQALKPQAQQAAEVAKVQAREGVRAVGKGARVAAQEAGRGFVEGAVEAGRAAREELKDVAREVGGQAAAGAREQVGWKELLFGIKKR